MGKHEVLRDKRVRAWDDMSTGPLCELSHTLVIFWSIPIIEFNLDELTAARSLASRSQLAVRAPTVIAVRYLNLAQDPSGGEYGPTITGDPGNVG